MVQVPRIYVKCPTRLYFKYTKFCRYLFVQIPAVDVALVTALPAKVNANLLPRFDKEQGFLYVECRAARHVTERVVVLIDKKRNGTDF